MKTRFILLSILILGTITIAFGQQKPITPTKEETQQWLSEKIRQYSFEDAGTINRYNLNFKDDILIIDYSVSLVSSNGTTSLHATIKVPIKQIESFSFVEKPSTYWFKINIKNGANLISSEYDDQPLNMLSSTNIILSKSLDRESLKDRITKAFTHLVELYTGELKKEIF